VKARYGTGVLSGFVRMNGRTIGSATSGATERANADAQALFEYLWTTDPNLTVSSGRGGSANADWLANKTIALPDMRGCVIAGMDDMGASAASILTSTFYGASAATLGNAGGTQSITLTLAQVPAHTHTGTATGTTNNSTTDHTHNFSGTTTVESNDHTHTTTGANSRILTRARRSISPARRSKSQSASKARNCRRSAVRIPTRILSSRHRRRSANSTLLSARPTPASYAPECTISA
jgi:microcystin-dependent protein